MKGIIKILSFMTLTLIFLAMNSQKTIELDLVWEDSGRSAYYFELIEKSLEKIDYKVKINKHPDMPRARLNKSILNGDITLFWFIETEDRNKNFTIVNEEISNNMFGKRVFLIPKDSQFEYDDINSIDDLRNSGKAAGFGNDWYDIEIWKNSKLAFIEHPDDWHNLYVLTASKSRKVNYFPRSITEVYYEYQSIQQHLDIEKNLLFSYDAELKLYLGKAHEDKKHILEKALSKAKESGLMDELIQKHWGEALDYLEIDNRKILNIDI